MNSNIMMDKRQKRPFHKRDREPREFEQRIVDLARVTRVMAGGKRLRFRACVAIGDKKGKVGVAIGKGADVAIAVNKAVNIAKKNMVEIPFRKGTIPHEVRVKLCGSRILLKPAPLGTGIKAGGVLRIVLELGGVPNVVAKILGSSNKINNAQALMKALQSFVVSGEKKKEEKPAAKPAKPEKKEDKKKEEKKPAGPKK